MRVQHCRRGGQLPYATMPTVGRDAAAVLIATLMRDLPLAARGNVAALARLGAVLVPFRIAGRMVSSLSHNHSSHSPLSLSFPTFLLPTLLPPSHSLPPLTQ